MELPCRAFKISCGCVVFFAHDATDDTNHSTFISCNDAHHDQDGPYFASFAEIILNMVSGHDE